MTLPEKHFKKTKRLLNRIDKSKIAKWLLTEGYYPEHYVLPPSFKIDKFNLKKKRYKENLNELPRRQLVRISYPKSPLTSRVFSIQHPFIYHDIVHCLIDEWDKIIKHLFPDKINIFSYSFPIPLNAKNVGKLGNLRAGRMIYEWIEMAEKDLVAESHKYRYLIRTDITNFYNSVYTHSIGWALHGRLEALADTDLTLCGCKIDRLIQYANDGRTNGIPVGSALSDLIAEILLTKIDSNVSIKLKSLTFLGTRFKDDYRILCTSEKDSKEILKALSEELSDFNLLINENKTSLHKLPEGMYRQHDREYYPISVRKLSKINFKQFEHTLLKALDIHRNYPGTSILEKFLSELFDKEYNLKLSYSTVGNTQYKQILKTLSLLILLKRESEKTLCLILAILEDIYLKYKDKHNLKSIFKELIEEEMKYASQNDSVFELTWLLFFSRYLSLGIVEISTIIDDKHKQNLFLDSIITSTQKIFNDSKITMFRKPKDCHKLKLAKRVAAFNRERD